MAKRFDECRNICPTCGAGCEGPLYHDEFPHGCKNFHRWSPPYGREELTRSEKFLLEDWLTQGWSVQRISQELEVPARLVWDCVWAHPSVKVNLHLTEEDIYRRQTQGATPKPPRMLSRLEIRRFRTIAGKIKRRDGIQDRDRHGLTCPTCHGFFSTRKWFKKHVIEGKNKNCAQKAEKHAHRR